MFQWLRKWMGCDDGKEISVIYTEDSLALKQAMSEPPPELEGCDYVTPIDLYVVHIPEHGWMAYAKNWQLAFTGNTPEVALEKMWNQLAYYTHTYYDKVKET